MEDECSSAKAAMEAMESCRKVEADEWKSPSLGMLKFRGSKVWEDNLDEMRGVDGKGDNEFFACKKLAMTCV